MQYLELRPHPRLAPVIQSYWTLCGVGPRGRVERVLPDGSTELVLHFGERFHRRDAAGARERQARTLFVGQMTEHVLLEPGRAVDVVGVRFRPGGASSFLGAPMSELTDTIHDLADVGSRSVVSLLQRLGDVDGPYDRLDVLERELLDRVDRTPAPDAAVAHVAERLLATGGLCSLDRLARDCGFGPRQLQRRFHESVGVTPKLFARIARFQRALARLDGDAHGRLGDVAAHCGYYDQAHLIRDFKQFAGITPRRFLDETHEVSDHFTGKES